MAAAAMLLVLAALLPAAVATAATTDGCDSGSSPSMRGAANQLAAAAVAACFTNAAHLASSSSTGAGTAAAGPTCDASLLANQMTKLCVVETDAPGPLCCAIVVMTIEMDCLCTVAEGFEFALSDLSVSVVWSWYKTCGGRRRSVPQNEDRCQPAPSPPPPPPAARPEEPSAWPLGLRVALGLLCAAALIAAASVALRLWLRRAVNVPVHTRCQGALNMCAQQPASAPSGSGDAASAVMTGEEAQASPSPPHERSQAEEMSPVARPRLPAAPPFHPVPPAFLRDVLRDILMPAALPPPAIVVPRPETVINAPPPGVMAQ